MSKILDRYASAVHSANLKSEVDTVYSDSDVVGAAGLAGKRHALAMALTRLFSGDNREAHALVRAMAELVWFRAHGQKVKLKRVQSVDLARAVLAWHRDGTCRACGGHGFEIIGGTRTVGDSACQACFGAGRVPFDAQFSLERLDLARWLLAEVQREQGKAGPAAMAKLAPRLTIG